jgi:DNA polymerase-3 subunit epsilon
MHLFAPSLAIVDLETTGTHAGRDRITEIGVVRVDADAAGGEPRVQEWSTLVDPEMPIPPAIQALTGITDAMTRSAPTVLACRREVRERLSDCVFVAHNARFDHGFLKHEFARVGAPFSSRPLCTVRLSRRLFPEAEGHGLDAWRRSRIDVTQRHRALGDARAVWSFLKALYREIAPDAIENAVRRILRVPSLPPQLPPDCLDAIPEAPGVYRFFGDNPLPIYIGKSINLRERVAAHFSGDWRSETDLRLSQEIRRIEFEQTAGELGALLRERCSSRPSCLRTIARCAARRKPSCWCSIGTAAPLACARRRASRPGRPYVPSRPGEARARSCARSPRSTVVLDTPAAGASGVRTLLSTPAQALHGRLHRRRTVRRARCAAGRRTARYSIPAWPVPALLSFVKPRSTASAVDAHLVRDWCWLGTASDDGDLQRLIEAPPPPSFDIDVARLLIGTTRREPFA